MTKPFEQLLRECIQQLEAGETDVEAVLARHGDRADQLRPHLRLWVSLSNVGKEIASREGYDRGFQTLTSAVATAGQKTGGNHMNDLARSGGLALKLAGGTAIVAVAVLAITYFSGNLHVDVGADDAAADHTNACLDSVLGNLADPQDDHFTFEDLLAFRQAFEDQNTDPRYDTDGDGDVDIDDVMSYIQALKDCFVPPPPEP
jgi:hypothetical protein